MIEAHESRGQRERIAPLLERAYRMALVLQARSQPWTGTADIQAPAFERFAIAAELVELLDEARAVLLHKSVRTATSGRDVK